MHNIVTIAELNEKHGDKIWDVTYLKIAQTIAEQSNAKRRKVGSVLVKNNSIISFGYNGMPKGWTNVCEITDGDNVVTKNEVLHAETNAITKVARSTMSSDDSTIYVTLSPCMDCSKLIVQSGIRRVVFSDQYRDLSGIQFLIKSGIEVLQIKLSDA